jgi:hypothetical protein
MYDQENPNRPEDDPALTPAERELAGALSRLRPAAPSGFARDRLLFEAGRAAAGAAASRPLFRWRVTAAAAAVLAGAAGVMLAARLERSPQVVREIVYVDRPTPATTPPVKTTPSTNLIAWADASRAPSRLLLTPASDEAEYLAIRDRALRWGISAALATAPNPPAHAKPQPALDVNQLLDDGAGVPSKSKNSTNHREQL